MADEGQQLLVVLAAKFDKYERDLTRQQQRSRDGFRRMQKDADDAGKSMERSMSRASASIAEKMEGMFSGFMKGGAVVAAVGGAALAIKQVADSVAEVDREARKAGVSSKVWQQWAYVATATGMSIDGMTDALKELNIRGDEFAKTGKGSAQEAFQRLGYSAVDVAQKLKDPNRFLDEIIGKLQTLDAAAQTRILDEVLGGTGAEQMAKVLGLSVTEIQKMRSEAATFTDEQIEAAKKIDREFSTMWRNFTVYAKRAAISGVEVASKIIGAINDPSGGARDKAVAAYNSPEKQLERLQEQRAKILRQIAETQSNSFSVLKEAELRQLRASLSAVDEKIHDVTGGSKEFEEALKSLSNASLSLSTNMNGNVTSAENFKAALIDLKNFMPELKAEMDSLATIDGIDAAYQRAVGNARTMGQVMNATDIANRAKSVVRYGKHDNILDLIASVESGGDYNATLDNGRWTGGAQNLTGMTLNQVRALQRQMLANPANRALYGDGKGSSALGRYQIVGSTLEGLIKELGLSGDRLFDEKTQDELARALLRRRGNDPSGLRNEWEGLKRVDDGTIRNAYNGTPTSAQPLAPTDGERQRTALIKQQDAARKSLNQSVQEGLDLARFEASISGMSASQQRIELGMYQAQAEAKRAGITLSDQELAKLREKITLTTQLDATNQQVAASSDGLMNAQMYFAESFTSSLSGLLSGTQTLNGALRSLLSSLIDATLQAALLGKGPLGGLFGGGLGSGILGAIFGFESGGYTGDGGRSEPAGIVHRGEYVMSAVATRRIGVGNLEALHTGALKGYSDGGYVTPTPSISTGFSGGFSASQTQNISIAPTITVNGSAGTPEQNADLAKQISKEFEGTVRGLVAKEMLIASRPGGFANSRSR